MKTDPLFVSSSTPTLEALEIMQSNRIGCLPVVDDGQLVGILTSYDFLAGAARIFREHLGKTAALTSAPKSKAHFA
jgi:CBS domain-containing protein